MNIFDYFKQKNIDTVNVSFYRKIDEWNSWYRSNVRRFHFYKVYTGSGGYCKKRRLSLGMAKQVSEDMANLLLNEKVKYVIGQPGEDSGNVEDSASNATYDYVKSVLESNGWPVLGNEYQERKAATGTVAYVPYISDGVADESGNLTGGQVKINYLSAESVFPLSWENGRVTECVFAFQKSWLRKKYVQLQFHRLVNTEDGQQYVIENQVLENTTGAGKELLPEEWKQLKPFENLAERVETGSDQPQFVIDKLNIVNNADEDETNPMGMALFANAVDVLQSIDLKYDSYGNEFDLGKKRIFVSPQAMRLVNGDPVFDTNDTVFYQLPEDYAGDEGGFLHEVDMSLRIEEHSRAIDDDLNLLSLKCGFGKDHYKFEAGQVRTATEVVSENSDLFRTLKKHEIILDSVMKELIRIIIRLGIVTGVPNLVPDPVITIDFDDSIIEDKVAERVSDRQDVNMGAMSLPEYRAKWYGETEEQALKRLPNTEDDLQEEPED